MDKILTRQEYFTLKKEKAQQKLDEYIKNPNYCECGCGQIVNMNCKRVNGHNNIGKKRSEKSKQKMAESQIGNHNKLGWRKNPTIEKFCINCGKKLEGKQQKFCSNHCKNIVISREREWTHEMKRKLRISTMKWVSEKRNNGLQVVPGWNPKACDLFEKFDKINNTLGHHARNGGEYYIKELGYWVDYINHDLKLIIEYDESHHERQKEKDKYRQQEIESFYKDYKFVRIKDTDLIDPKDLMDLIQ